jgi:copper homeostasis protein CutC
MKKERLFACLLAGLLAAVPAGGPALAGEAADAAAASGTAEQAAEQQPDESGEQTEENDPEAEAAEAPAAGIRPDNVRQIVEETGCTQVHLSGQSVRHDPSWPEKTPLWFSSPDAADGGAWRETDAELFRQIRLNLQPLEHKEE